MKDVKVLALIPARSGSKGIRDKNIKLLNNKPMMAHTIDAALESGIFKDVIVSTDSKKYAQIAQNHGAEVPFLRPVNLAEDNSSTIDMILHTLDRLEKENRSYDYFMLLQPTSPLRDSDDIKNAMDLLLKTASTSVVSVNECDSPKLVNTLDGSLSMENFISLSDNKRRQELGKYYKLNGAIYLSDTRVFLREKSFYTKKSKAYIMDKRNSIDIDEDIDFKIAECILKEE